MTERINEHVSLTQIGSELITGEMPAIETAELIDEVCHRVNFDAETARVVKTATPCPFQCYALDRAIEKLEE